VRHFQLARRAGVPTAAAVIIGLLVATPAYADVTVSPATAVQGSGENLTLKVTNTGTQPVGTITLRLPADTPIAEVFPLSVDDWAPKIEPRTLSTPLTTIHGGTPVTETAAAITWIAMPGKALAPGRSADVAVAVGPLPTVGSLRLVIETKYANGTAGPAMGAATLALTPAKPGQVPPAHHGGAIGTGADTDPGAAENQLFADTVRDAGRGASIWSMGGWVVAGLVLLGAAAMMLRNRHRRVTDEDDEPDDEGSPDETPAATAAETKEPVAAGSSKWAYKG
jgi:hypothetical protein